MLDEVGQGAAATMSLALGAGFIWLLRRSWWARSRVKAGKYADRLLTVLAMVGVSFPPFFLGAVLLYYLGYKANIFPLADTCSCTEPVAVVYVHLVLPWFTLSVLFIGFYSRVLRSTILDTINEDYVRTAKAKGLLSARCCSATSCATA